MRRVKIYSMAFGGTGVGRIDGKVIFVPGTLAGEEVVVEITSEKKDYLIGQVKEILTSSPLRVQAPCPYFGTCGGCQWQHIDPSAQETFKKEILIDLLHRIAGLKEVPVISTAPSSPPFGYRIRVQCKVQRSRIGFFAQQSRRIVEVEGCLIAHSLINLILRHLRERPHLLSGAAQIEINVSPDEGKGILVLHGCLPPKGKKPFLKDLLQPPSPLKGIALTRKGDWEFLGDPYLNLTVPLKRGERTMAFRFRVSPGSFCQVNPYQNPQLIQTVLEFGDLGKGDRVLDLYAGIGNLSLPLAAETGWVMGIEEDATAVADARYNAKVNRIKNCQFRLGRVEEKLGEAGEGWKLLVLDPPRAGGKRITEEITRLAPEKIVYVSCDPATFSRDVHFFVKKGYALQQVRLIDMFPQTYHMEVVGLFLRS
ncbi:MAG: class I SAM-dependent RNA methyltransferase [Desulfobacterota bacterium]|nr:class I SAM-dependent RNA methyltransferase [Thermodesulfobacteriota bacterium]